LLIRHLINRSNNLNWYRFTYCPRWK